MIKYNTSKIKAIVYNPSVDIPEELWGSIFPNYSDLTNIKLRVYFKKSNLEWCNALFEVEYDGSGGYTRKQLSIKTPGSDCEEAFKELNEEIIEEGKRYWFEDIDSKTLKFLTKKQAEKEFETIILRELNL